MIAAATVTAIVAIGFAGCKSPSGYHKQADKVAADIITKKQQQALGRTEPFTIERPQDTFRRRLIEAQGLPVVGQESLGTGKVPKPSDWPEKSAAGGHEAGDGKRAATAEPVKLSLFEALEVAASSSSEYQGQKEGLFRTALDLDLRRNDFRSIFSSDGETVFVTNHSQGKPDNSMVTSASLNWSQAFETGASVSAGLALDLASLLTGEKHSSLGIVADTSVSVPLLRGAGRRVVLEPLTQAERSVVYSINNFQQYRRQFAVRVASEYLQVLRSLDSVKNAEDNYKSLVTSGRRARRLADAGRLPEIQVDQARQDELRARARWITAIESYQSSLDRFKGTLGLPTDAAITLDGDELRRLAVAAQGALGNAVPENNAGAMESTSSALAAVAAQGALGSAAPENNAGAMESTSSALAADAPVVLVGPSREGAGPYEIDERQAIELALANRTDLRTTLGQLYDAERAVIVAANAFLPGLNVQADGTFGQSRSPGSAASPDAQLRPGSGNYDLSVAADVPWNKVAQRNSYRKALIAFEQAERGLQQAEDQVKLDIRNDLRTLLTARESIKIQFVAVEVARRRVDSVELFLQAGRAEIRDLLDAQEALISAQDALTASLVDYRVAALALQRDMGLLETDEKGLWREYDPAKFQEKQ